MASSKESAPKSKRWSAEAAKEKAAAAAKLMVHLAEAGRPLESLMQLEHQGSQLGRLDPSCWKLLANFWKISLKRSQEL